MFWLELLAAMALTLAALASGTRAMAMDGLDAALGTNPGERFLHLDNSRNETRSRVLPSLLTPCL